MSSRFQAEPSPRFWWAWLVGLVILLAGGIASFALYRMIRASETDHQHTQLQSVMSAMQVQAGMAVEQRVQAMIRVAEGLAWRSDITRENWGREAQLRMQHESGFVAMAITDWDGVIQWLEETEDAGLEEGQRLPVDPAYRAALVESVPASPMTMAHTALELFIMPDGRPAALLVVPIARDEDLRGFLVGIRTLLEGIDSLLPPFEAAGVDLTVQRQEVTVYRSAAQATAASLLPSETFRLDYAGFGPPWDFLVTLQAPATSSSHGYLAISVLAMGLIMTLMTALLAILGLSRYSHGVALKQANRTLRDEIGERLNMQHELTFLARHDPLTRLPNRLEFVRQAELKLAEHRSGQLALMFLDVDAFKDINDSMGHVAGDELLQRIAGSLADVLLAGDCLGRYGGDEFVIAAERSNRAQLEELAANILAHFERGFQLNDHRYHVTASIGIAIFPQGGEDIEMLIRNADAALFQAKHEGRHRYALFEPNLRNRVSRRHMLSQDISRALADQEFRVVYQPIVRLADQQLCGVEALMRWHRFDGEVIGPAEFIPTAEQSGMIGQLSRLAFDIVGRDMMAWRHLRDAPIRVSVNISGSRFKQPGFFERLNEMLEHHELPPDQLQLEITEQVLVEDLPRIRVALDRIAELGVQLAVDDFGVGYSSLAYLKNLPVSTVKIDRTFIQGLANDRQDLAITRAICDLAIELGMQTVAEGVETEEQLHLLAVFGCHMGQGYWFSRPVEAANIAEMLRMGEPWRDETLPLRQVSDS